MNKITLSKEANKIRQLQIFSPQTGYQVDYLRFLTSELGELWQNFR